METLNTLGRPTTRLGFGGSLLGSSSTSHATRLLSAAFDAGIRHFDVAPMYGFGRSEHLLRAALGSRIDEVTVTTKYGLDPPAQSSWIAPLHRMARIVLTSFPAVRRRLRSRLTQSTGQPAPLTAKAAQISLENSLRQLGRDRVDLFLLHEATPQRLEDDALLNMLREAVGQGKITNFGVGSSSAQALACFRERPQYCPILQFEWSVFSSDLSELDPTPHLNHGSLGGHRLPFIHWLSKENRETEWTKAVDADLRKPGMVNDLLLKAALLRKPASIVLFSTRSEPNIFRNINVLGNDSLRAPAQALHELIQRVYVPLLRDDASPRDHADRVSSPSKELNESRHNADP